MDEYRGLDSETKNLWNAPKAQAIKQLLLQEMLAFHIESIVKTRNTRRLTVSPKEHIAI